MLLSLSFGFLIGCTEDKMFGDDLGFSTAEIDFGVVTPGQKKQELLTITNYGMIDISILSATLHEGQNGTWEITKPEDSDLSTRESLDITIVFQPAFTRVENAQLHVRTTVEEYSNIYISMRGEGGPIDYDGDGFTNVDGDCDETDHRVYPGAEEICDGKDNDCDGFKPEHEKDEDRDGVRICQGDCNDVDNMIYPNAPEICDDKDNDCNGIIEEHLDQDNDGFTLCTGDCDDTNDAMWPGNYELCDEIDNDCSGQADDVDTDGDGYSSCTPGGDCNEGNPLAHPILVSAGAMGGDGTPENPYGDLDTAVANRNGYCPIIYLQEGNYTMGLGWSSGFIALEGLGDSPNLVKISPTEGRILEAVNQSTVRFSNLTLHGSNSQGDGGAIRLVGANLELSNVRVENNSASADGGGIAANTSSIVIRNSFFENNTAGDDGGAIALFESRLDDDGSTYNANVASKGGAIMSESSDIYSDGVSMSSNQASEIGGAIYFNGNGDLQLQKGRIWQNTSVLFGGGICLIDHVNPSSFVRNNRFQGNESEQYGGGIALIGESALVVANNTFVDNTAVADGSGVYIEGESALGTAVWANIFYQNAGSNTVFSTIQNQASIGYNTFYLDSQEAYSCGVGSDFGFNEIRDPQFVSYSNDNSVSNDNLQLQIGSPEIDSGPQNSQQPLLIENWNYFWSDLDGSQNDRGFTGGPAGE